MAWSQKGFKRGQALGQAQTFECVENGNPRSNPTGFIMPDGALLNFEKLTAEEWLRLSLCDAIV
jgi:hypothetical protein